MPKWWLWRLCGATAVHDPGGPGACSTIRTWLRAAMPPPSVAEPSSPNTMAGSSRLDPISIPRGPSTRSMSANRLQKIGNCPLEYFFEYGLNIALPDELTVDPTVWLDSSVQLARCLHELFENFIRELMAGREDSQLQT